MSKAWMAIYWGDYRQNTGHFNCTENGAYLMMLAHYWENGGLPESGPECLRRLYTICAAVSEAERKAVRFVVDTMFVKQGHKYINRRMDLEIVKADNLRARRSESGKKGGRPRKQMVLPHKAKKKQMVLPHKAKKKQMVLPYKAKGMQSQSQSQSQLSGKVSDRILRSATTTKPCRFCGADIAITKPVCSRPECIHSYQRDSHREYSKDSSKEKPKAKPTRRKKRAKRKQT